MDYTSNNDIDRIPHFAFEAPFKWTIKQYSHNVTTGQDEITVECWKAGKLKNTRFITTVTVNHIECGTLVDYVNVVKQVPEFNGSTPIT